MRGEENRSSPVQVRTRQGCLTCRRRRRRCDEQKPECQNCIERRLTCRYGIQLRFRACNLFNLVPEDARALRETTPRLYRHIRFVDGLNDVESDFEVDLENDSNLPSLEELPTETLVMADPDSRVVFNPATGGELSLEEPQHEVDEAHSYNNRMTGTEFSDRTGGGNDEEPLNPALELHSSTSTQSFHQSTSVGREPINEPHLSEEAESNHHLMVLTSPRDSFQHHSEDSGLSTVSDYSKNWLPPLDQISKRSNLAIGESSHQALASEERNRLLKFYVDNVAPWLDISAAEKSFGVHVPILAKEYTPLFHSILALSAQYESVLMPLDKSKATQSTNSANQAVTFLGTDIYSSRDAPVVACTLLLICRLLSTQIHEWRPVLKDRIQFLESIGVSGTSDGYRGSASWMILRLDLALGLLSATEPMISTEKYVLISTPLSNSIGDEAFAKSEEHVWTRKSILLCSRAAQLCFSPEASSRSTANKWLRLWNSIRPWFESLPLAMNPIFTSPISAIPSATPHFFPIILYNSCSSMYSAVLYHTACALLLQSKPHVVRALPHRKTPTWHAVQICGICIGNNASWSNDPTILASLVYASRFISYQEQNQELQQFIRNLDKTSSWPIESSIYDGFQQ